MTDLKSNSFSASSNHAANDSGAEQLASLHKMSTTAGLGSQDYVAINLPAVMALLVGFIGLLALLEPLFLFIPIIGVICGLFAVRQIKNSNGTQTGRPIAWAGLVLCGGVAAFVLTGFLIGNFRARADGRTIASIIDQLGQHVNAQQMDQAYALFAPSFTQRVSKQAFSDRWKELQSSKYYGIIEKIECNGIFHFSEDAITGQDTAVTLGVAALKGGGEDRLAIIFRQVGDKWLIDEIPRLFPLPATP